MNTYSEDNGLTINHNKTKAMIFNKSGKVIHRRYSIGALTIETTKEYKYLGFKVTPAGGISSGIADLKDRAFKALMKLTKKMGTLFRKHPLTTIKLFDALIRPILLYASDFWGVLKMPKHNPIEILHLHVCKQLY